MRGVITLTGHVPTHADQLAAEHLTKRVHGVKAIANEIEVSPSESHQREDEQIALAAVHALEWNAKVPHERVQVVVSDGWITLDGTTDHRYERNEAERAVRHLLGIRGVTNKIEVKPEQSRGMQRKTVGQTKEGIENALRRSSLVNSKQVDIEVVERTAILSGDVRSHAERDEAERLVWMAPGVSEV